MTKKKLFHSFSPRFFCCFGVGLAATAALAAVVFLIFRSFMLDYPGEMYSTYFTLCSTTFIVTSMLSFLSGSEQDILWTDTISCTLIDPVINFECMTALLMANLAISTLCTVFNLAAPLLFCFLLAIVILAVMTCRVVQSHFGREKLMDCLTAEYRACSGSKQKEKLDSLRQKAVKHIVSGDNDKLYEILDFLRQDRSRSQENTSSKTGQPSRPVLPGLRELPQPQLDAIREIMAYLCSANIELFAKTADEKELLADEEIRQLLESECERLAITHEKPQIKAQVLELLYANPRFDPDIISALNADLIQACTLPAKEEQDADLSEASELLQEISKPVRLLFHAFDSSDLKTFDMVLDHLSNSRSKLIRELFEPRLFSSGYPETPSQVLQGKLADYQNKFFSQSDLQILDGIRRANGEKCRLIPEQRKKLDGLFIAQTYEALAAQWAFDSEKYSVPLASGVNPSTADGLAHYQSGAYNEALKAWRTAAAAKGPDPEALYDLGLMYASGTGVESNAKRAFLHFRQAAELGLAAAQYHLAMACKTGRGTPQNYLNALTWFERAAQQGHAAAQYEMGLSCKKKHDHAAALRWFSPAARQGHIGAQYNVGWAYHHGKGTLEDLQEAINYYLPAAEQGHADAQCQLGWICKSRKSEQGHAEAVQWFRKAEKQNHADAQYNIGWAYEYGKGVKQDRQQALQYYRLAAAQNHPFAIKSLRELEKGTQGGK